MDNYNMITELENIIAKAIKTQNILSIQYEGHQRFVEPHLLGIAMTGNFLLNAYQTSGGSNSGGTPQWRRFNLAKIEEISLVPSHFARPRPDYNPNDNAMQRIIAKLD